MLNVRFSYRQPILFSLLLIVLGGGAEHASASQEYVYSDYVPSDWQPVYDSGFSVGFDAGYPEGLIMGDEQGHIEGQSEGYNDGFSAGWDETFQPAYDEAYAVAQPVGYDEGHHFAYSVAHAWGVAFGEAVYTGGTYTGPFPFSDAYLRTPGGGGAGSILTFDPFDGFIFSFPELVDDAESYYYDRGVVEGNEAGYESGYAEGYASAYELVYGEAYANGLPIGRQEGATEGLAQGEAAGLTDGRYDGSIDGELLGFFAGYQAGYEATYRADRAVDIGAFSLVVAPQLVGRHTPIIAPNYGAIPEPTAALIVTGVLAAASTRRGAASAKG